MTTDLPIRVTPEATQTTLWAMEDWNDAAGIELFVIGEPAQVVIGEPDDTNPYAIRFDGVCSVHNTYRTSVWRHELGHCLGLADSKWAWMAEDHVVCDDPEHPNYSEYTGAMSYCNIEHDITMADTCALRELGYPAMCWNRRGRIRR